MKKQRRKWNLKKKKSGLFLLLIVFAISGYFFVNPVRLKASTVVGVGDFRLNAENRWSGDEKKSYADLEWDGVSDLDKSGYQLYQSEDGNIWNLRSLNYGKAIKVLNVYPRMPSSKGLEEWMNGLDLKNSIGEKLISVEPISLADYDKDPDKYLKNPQGEYLYDVIMFGSYDYNFNMDIKTKLGVSATQEFVDAGRGVLFGHDTITPNDTRPHAGFNTFADQLGFKLVSSSYQVGSAYVRVVNNGYLMKYPFEIPNDVTLQIPLTHSWGQGILNGSTTTKWLKFVGPFRWDTYGNTKVADANFYLATNGNLGMIQTGHSKGSSTLEERQIIANTLYNLAQVSFETTAQDQTVKDDQAPALASIVQKSGGSIENFDIEVDSVDQGKEYQWYVKADTRSSGLKKSDVVKETITSNIAGYFYKIDNSPTSSLDATVEGYKDKFGRIASSSYDIYVAPTSNTEDPNYDPTKDANLVNYNTKGTITGINGLTDLDKYIHVVTVDRTDNVSKVKTIQIKSLMSNFRISERYVDTEGTQIQPNSYLNISPGGVYEKDLKNIDNYIIDSYQIDNEARVPTSPDKKVSIEQISKDYTVTYYYNKLIELNIRQVVLSSHSEMILPNKGYIQLDNGKIDKKSNVFNVAVNSGEETENISYSSVKLAKSGGHHQLLVTLMLPEYYRYSGYIATTSDISHDSKNKTAGEIDLDIKDGGKYWLTVYVEPDISQDSSPTPYSWNYEKNQLGKIDNK